MRSVFAAILLLAYGMCWGAPAVPEQSSAWGVRQLMESMAAVQSSKRKFTERKYMSVLTTPLESSGTLLYERPARLEKHTLLPKEERMVLNQGILSVENRAGQVQRVMMLDQYPAIGAFVESIRATLAGDQKTLERYYEIKLEGSSVRWHLQLVPREVATRDVVREIRMEGRGNRISTIEILEANGDHSVMTVTGE